MYAFTYSNTRRLIVLFQELFLFLFYIIIEDYKNIKIFILNILLNYICICLYKSLQKIK